MLFTFESALRTGAHSGGVERSVRILLISSSHLNDHTKYYRLESQSLHHSNDPKPSNIFPELDCNSLRFSLLLGVLEIVFYCDHTEASMLDSRLRNTVERYRGQRAKELSLRVVLSPMPCAPAHDRVPRGGHQG